MVETLYLNRDLFGCVGWSSNFVQFRLFPFALRHVRHCSNFNLCFLTSDESQVCYPFASDYAIRVVVTGYN